ncbi:MAG TPA: PIN domain-containing protein [Candidatus Dormibacteraeota bacterium]|nr:PIN domain-containing protein [Candidatus Dormibacteraeota bacterium]
MIAIDSNIFIYWLERNPDFYKASTEIIKQIYSGDKPASCSAIVLAEVYNGSSRVTDAIVKLPNLTIVPTTEAVAFLAGKFRYEYKLKVIDAIHAASAFISEADLLITNDIFFSKKKIPGLTIALLTEMT